MTIEIIRILETNQTAIKQLGDDIMDVKKQIAELRREICQN